MITTTTTTTARIRIVMGNLPEPLPDDEGLVIAEYWFWATVTGSGLARLIDGPPLRTVGGVGRLIDANEAHSLLVVGRLAARDRERVRVDPASSAESARARDAEPAKDAGRPTVEAAREHEPAVRAGELPVVERENDQLAGVVVGVRASSDSVYGPRSVPLTVSVPEGRC